MLWGSAVSSHQVEGGNHNDWTVWEQSPGRLLELKKSGRIKNSGQQMFISDQAADFYHRFESDLDLAQSLNHTCFRFSLEWSRIEPEPGQFSEIGLNFYRRLIKACLDRSIEPIVTLWHWTHPLWVSRQGGWLHSGIVGLFDRYTKRVAEEFGGDVKYWLTLNEPEVFASNAYWTGRRPPQVRNPMAVVRASHNLVKAHTTSYQTLKRLWPNSQVGLAKHQITFDQANQGLISKAVVNLVQSVWNDWWLGQANGQIDYWGLNYYLHRTIGLSIMPPKWSSTAENSNRQLNRAVRELFQRTKKPILITENGTWRGDEVRQEMIQQAVNELPKLEKSGIPIIGYCHWSLLDNFEWESGYGEKFGLIEVDFQTLKRRLKASAKLYQNLLDNLA